MINVIFPTGTEKYRGLQCNDQLLDYEFCPELQQVDHIIRNLSPQHVLELGAGLGRGSVYLNKKYNWKRVHYYVVDTITLLLGILALGKIF